MQTIAFDRIRDIVYRSSGIALSDRKYAMVSARLGKRLNALGVPDLESYVIQLEQDVDGTEISALVDALSTNVTGFFREASHFDQTASILGEWRARGQSRFRLWSAACSTGEEAYSLAMTARQVLGPEADLKILATDISTNVLGTARDGIYAKEKAKPLPGWLRDRYMSPVASDTLQVDPAIRDIVSVSKLNLSAPPFPMHGPLDIVFCRNVMIYFDTEVRAHLLNEMRRLIRPDGYLIIGHAENLNSIGSGFEVVRPSVYRRLQ